MELVKIVAAEPLIQPGILEAVEKVEVQILEEIKVDKQTDKQTDKQSDDTRKMNLTATASVLNLVLKKPTSSTSVAVTSSESAAVPSKENIEQVRLN